MSADSLTLRARPAKDGQGWEILAPAVGLYARGPERGAYRVAGEEAGVLIVLDRVLRLVLPDGVAGTIDTAPPERRHLPVGFGDQLFSVRVGGTTGGAVAAPGAEKAVRGVPTVKAFQAGRFWRRPDPQSPEFVQPDEALAAGRTLGLLEVMKTFNPVKYAPGGELPVAARLVRFLVDDGAEVEEGQPLAEVAAAGGD